MFDKIKYYSNLFLSSKTPEYKRSIFNKINFKEKIIGLKGAKGVGKTTIIHQYLNSLSFPLNEKLYISLDNLLLKNLLYLILLKRLIKETLR